MPKFLICLGMVFLTAVAFGQTRVEIRPIDLHSDLTEVPYFQKIFQLETYGKHILVRTPQQELVLLDQQGKWIRNIAACEEGSEDFRKISGVSVWGKQMMALNLKRTIFYVNQDGYQHYKTSEYYASGALAPHFNSNAFGFDGHRLVIAARPHMKKMAVALNKQGDLIRAFGASESFPEELVQLQPAIHASFWAWDGQFWYGLFKFKPVIKKFDAEFKLIKTFTVLGEEIADKEEALYNLTPEQRQGRHGIVPHFSDFKVFGESLYMMCGNALYEVDKELTQVTGIYYFKGKGTEFSHLDPSTRLTLPFFTFLPKGTLVLGHPGLMWGHDLWLTELPSTQSGATVQTKTR